MALVKGTNAYVNVAEAEAYFANRLDVAAWTEAPAAQKEQALVTATAMLDELNWTGRVVGESQALAFPRVGCYYDPRLGFETVLPDSVPDRVVVATYELAYHLLNNDGLLDDSGVVDTLSLGSINLGKIRAPNKIPSAVRNKIKPLLLNGDQNLWWRAN